MCDLCQARGELWVLRRLIDILEHHGQPGRQFAQQGPEFLCGLLSASNPAAQSGLKNGTGPKMAIGMEVDPQ